MSGDTIRCLIYRYKRIRERLCAVLIKESEYIALNEIDYKVNEDFFLYDKFAKFIGYTSKCSLDLCIISQSEAQGEEFAEFCKKYYNYNDNDVNNTIWTKEYIRDALLSLNLKTSLIVEDIVIEGKDGKRPNSASIYRKKKSETTITDNDKDSSKPNKAGASVENVQNDHEASTKNIQNAHETCSNKSKLSLAMEKIIEETYNI